MTWAGEPGNLVVLEPCILHRDFNTSHAALHGGRLLGRCSLDEGILANQGLLFPGHPYMNEPD
jgi:hypothetical protein